MLEKIYHKYSTYNGSEMLTIYVEYPDSYEFSLDFETLKKNAKSLASKIREYAFKNIGTVSNQTVLLILNGVVVGTILLTSLNSKLQFKQITNLTSKNEIEISTSTINNIDNEVKEMTYTKQLEEEKKDTINTSKNSNIANKTQVKNSSVTNTTQQQAKSNTPNSDSKNTSTSEETNEGKVSVKLASGQILSISLEDYVVGVVASEMPASFNIEALKAQSVAARTYALKRSSTILSATTSDQVYKTEDQLRAMWGNSFNTYYNKVKSAVNSTRGKYITYNGTYIDALYFSTSNGKTEDPVYVWGKSYPYLKSVDSPFDTSLRSYSHTTSIPLSTFNQKLGVNVSDSSEINILSKTTGNRINQISIGNKIFTGVKVRTLLGLRSADFDISIVNSTVTISTRGFGHGCGMSQYGANEMAKQGKNYIQILKYYYTNVEIKG